MIPQNNTLMRHVQAYSIAPIGDDPDRAIDAMLAMLNAEGIDDSGISFTPGRRLRLVARKLSFFSDEIHEGMTNREMFDVLCREPGVGPSIAGCTLFDAMYRSTEPVYDEDLSGLHQYVRNGFSIAIKTWMLKQLTGISL